MSPQPVDWRNSGPLGNHTSRAARPTRPILLPMPTVIAWVGAFVLGIVAAVVWTIVAESQDLFHLGGGMVRLIAYVLVVGTTALAGVVMARHRRAGG